MREGVVDAGHGKGLGQRLDAVAGAEFEHFDDDSGAAVGRARDGELTAEELDRRTPRGSNATPTKWRRPLGARVFR